MLYLIIVVQIILSQNQDSIFNQEGLFVNGLILDKKSFYNNDESYIYTELTVKVLDVFNDNCKHLTNDTISIIYEGGKTETGFLERYPLAYKFIPNSQFIFQLIDSVKINNIKQKDYFIWKGYFIEIINNENYIAAGQNQLYPKKEDLIEAFCEKKGFDIDDLKIEAPYRTMNATYKSYDAYLEKTAKFRAIISKYDSLKAIQDSVKKIIKKG